MAGVVPTSAAPAGCFHETADHSIVERTLLPTIERIEVVTEAILERHRRLVRDTVAQDRELAA